MENFGLNVYELAANIGTPLAISATTILLFFILARFVVVKFEIPIKKTSGRHAFIVIMTVVTYGMIITIIALVGGLGLYGYEKVYDQYFSKQQIIDRAERALSNRETSSALTDGLKLSEKWPDDPHGFRISAIAYFMKEQYTQASIQFEKAIEKLGSGDPCETSKRNLVASLVATYASAKRLDDAAQKMSIISNCKLEKGMKLNQAKILIFTGFEDKAVALLNSQEMRAKTVPDYRDRVAFMSGIAHLRMQANNWERLARNEFATASCLNESFGKLIYKSVLASSTNPEGVLTQGFEMEVEVLKKPKFQSFFEENRDILEAGDVCRHVT